MNEIILTKTNHEVSRNRITTWTDTSSTVWTLPKKANRVSVQSAGRGRARLVIGGFKTITVSVVGPVDVIERLRNEVA